MIMFAFAVYDKAVKSFLPPFFCRSRGEAIRSFSDAVNNKEHQFNKHQADYVLYSCGAYDDASGHFQDVEPERLVSASEVDLEDVAVFPPEKRVAM